MLAVWGAAHTPVERPAPATPVVNDVTQLDPIPVSRVVIPKTTEEIVAAVRSHPGPISIGGGRYSMGGQTATEGALQIDMRGFDRILAFDSVARTITVQAGARWRQIQERIDRANLSVKIMQTYSNFTVGGSLSVNVHGRYVGLGPVVLSVRAIKVVLADGTVVEASPTRNREIFYGAIGGYGALGVITEATLDLADNVRVRRKDRRMPIGEYREWFFRHVRDSASGPGGVVFHNADIYPDDYETVNAVSYVQTDDPVTVPDRLIPRDRSYLLDRLAYRAISELPLGKRLRQHVIDPLVFRGEPVEWRNYEASYDVAELEPASRESSTYVLEEYFVPVERFDAFVPKMRDVFRRHRVNVVNVSIRHARPDPGTLLAWAPREVFAFVVYYKQRTDAASRDSVGVWTRELTDAVLGEGGSWYLPYQPHATPEQFLRAYPRAPELFALKRRLDPTNKFRNKLWDRYYPPAAAAVAAADPDRPAPAVRARLDSTPGYRRDEGQTFLTHPEWYIVYSSDEYAAWLQDSLPTTFPYAASIGQYWVNYGEARALTRRDYPFNGGYHVMLAVIGASYSAELALKAVYENTIGRFSGWTSGHRLSHADRFAHAVARDYGAFIHIYPWYEYRFAEKLRVLWLDLPLWGEYPVREWERRLFLTAEYGVKAVYATLIERATRAAYAPQEERMQMVVAGWPAAGGPPHREGSTTGAPAPTESPRPVLVARLDETHALVATPRYDGFRDAMLALASSPTPPRLVEIAGNDDILLTGVAPAGWRYGDDGGGASGARVLYALPLPSDARRKRVTMRVPVRELLPTLRRLAAERRLVVDHIYDY
ncbi:MAG: FAD-binding oxidoreductase [Gemmatimonadaceae bacterium]